MAWLDAGTPESLFEASSFVEIIEKRQGFKIACIEEVAFKSGFINETQLIQVLEQMPKSPYKAYLERVASNNIREESCLSSLIFTSSIIIGENNKG